MIIFKCDICGKPFEYNKSNINFVRFLNKTHDDNTIWLTSRSVGLPELKRIHDCEYHICQDCFTSIRHVINDIYGISQK